MNVLIVGAGLAGARCAETLRAEGFDGPIALVGLLIPGLSPYRPLATGLGVLAGELMLLVYVSFSLRRRIGARAWRRLHYVTFAVFAVATVHGLAAGTDRWAFGLYASSVAAVAGMTAWRVITKGGTTNAPVPHPDRQVAV